MKRLALLTTFFVLLGCASYASTDVYSIDDNAVEQLFDQGTDITSTFAGNAFDLSYGAFAPAAAPATMVSGKNAVAATVLAFFLGFLGIHRFYLGTKTSTGIGYILTCGGLGVVAFVDFILLLIGAINDDIDKYTDNPKFFMW